MNKILNIVGVVIAIVAIGAGVYSMTQKEVAPLVSNENPVENSVILSEEESLSLAQKIAVELNKNRPIECFSFSVHKQEGNAIIYKVKKEWEGNCPAFSPDAPIVPLIKIDRLSGNVWVQAIDGEFRPHESKSLSIANNNEMTNWKTYKNEKYGFEFKYPADWRLNSETIDKVESVKEGFDTGSSHVQLFTKDKDNHTQKLEIFFYIPNTTNNEYELMVRSPKAVVKEFDDIKWYTGKVSEVSDREYFDAFTAKAEVNKSYAGVTTNTIRISATGYTSFNEEKEGSVYSQELADKSLKVLSTFKFTDSISTSDWKTYKNDRYKFEFRYPENATLSTPSGNNDILNNTVISFDDKSTTYNNAAISINIYRKGVFKQPLANNKCEIYKHSTDIYDGITADIVEQKDCPGSEGSPIGGSGHTLTAILFLSNETDLVYQANLGNDYIRHYNIANQILSTFKFTK